MNRRTVFPVYRTNTISQYNDQRYEVMNSSVHIRRGSEVKLVLTCTESPLWEPVRALGGVV